MILGLTLILITGLIWCLNGIVISFLARKSLDFLATVFISTTISTIAAWAFLSNFHTLRTMHVEKIGLLALLMISAGMICAFSIIIMQRAMQGGHHGIIYSISNSAMIIPFLCGILIFGEILSSNKLLGMGFVIISFVIFGIGNPSSISPVKKDPKLLWLTLAFSSFLIMGTYQALSIVPSYWENWSDVANLRVPFLFTGFSLGYLIPLLIRKKLPDKRTVLFGVLVSPLGLPCQITFYKALDIMAGYDMVSVAYPLAVGINIISFVIYSLFFLREKTPRISIVGLLVGMTGLMLISA